MIEFRLDLPLMSKSRPRFGGGRAYMPQKYVQWKKDCADQLKKIWIENDLPTYDQQNQISLAVQVHGPGRMDPDNILGAFLDAGLPSKSGWRGCWKDDRVTVIPSICISWARSREEFWVVSVSTITE